MINNVQREKFDDIYTPKKAVYPLLKNIDTKFKNLTMWECTDPGNSKISEAFDEAGYNVVGTDITNGFDFLKDKPNFEFDFIVTNPPYSLKDEFIEKCYEYGKPFALLLPLTALEGIKRGTLFGNNGISLIVLNRRINFLNQKKANWFNASWFTYNLMNTLGNYYLLFEEVERT